MEQLSFLDDLYERYTIDKKVKLIEMFAGYGSQCSAFERLQAKGLCEFEQFRIVEWNCYSILAYYYLHSSDKTNYSSGMEKNDIVQVLLDKGVSLDWNKPATEKQLKNKTEQFIRDVYNAICATNNLVDISKVKGSELLMSEKERKKCCVVACYSFPCQDISIAGKMAGILANTRSGLLFEVERILLEMNELKQLPDVLLLENVKELLSEKHDNAFKGWLNTLHQLGYESYVKVLNASDYGVPQHRERCFVVSILNSANHYYTFPKSEPLKKVLKDLLEEDVDEKYYLSDKQIQEIQQWNAYEKPLEAMEKTDKTNISPTLTTRTSEYTASMILVKPKIIPIKNATKLGYLEATDGDGIDISGRMQYHRGTVQKGKTQSLTTMGGESVGVVVTEPNEKPSHNTYAAKINVVGNYSPSKYNASNVVEPNGLAPTVRENHGTITAITEPVLVGGFGNKCNKGTQYHNQNRIYSSSSSSAIPTSFQPNYQLPNLRIRKLTPRECFRLQGLKDNKIDKIIDKFGNSVLYHLAGDSIVVDVLEKIFNQML